MKSKIPYIYVVDDNVLNLKVIQKSIRKHNNCNIRIFTSAEECLRTVNLRVPDLILADYYLDSGYNNCINGDELLCKIKKQQPALHVIMYSSIEDFNLIVNMIKAGAQDFIPRDKDFINAITNATTKNIGKKIHGIEKFNY